MCFAAQQAAEKALKAICVYEQIDFPFTHNIERLRRLVPDRWAIADAAVHLSTLTPWAVAGRYPADAPEATTTEPTRVSIYPTVAPSWRAAHQMPQDVVRTRRHARARANDSKAP